MSSFGSDRLRADEGQVATARQGESTNLLGQRHDRFEGENEGDDSTMGSTASDSEPEVEISAGQKMLSAVSGSLLTSLLGREPCLSLATAMPTPFHWELC